MTQLALQPHRFTKDEYYRLGDLGILGGRVELIEGQIIDMAPQTDLHAAVVTLVHLALMKAFSPEQIRCQLPLAVSSSSEPEPDFAVVEGHPRDFIGKGHPKTALLVVEIADSTLEFNRKTKASLYARAGIADYWIVNLDENTIEVHRNPIKDRKAPMGWRYESPRIIEKSGSIAPLAAPGKRIAAKDILP